MSEPPVRTGKGTTAIVPIRHLSDDGFSRLGPAQDGRHS
jgi:hypothetical protein